MKPVHVFRVHIYPLPRTAQQLPTNFLSRMTQSKVRMALRVPWLIIILSAVLPNPFKSHNLLSAAIFTGAFFHSSFCKLDGSHYQDLQALNQGLMVIHLSSSSFLKTTVCLSANNHSETGLTSDAQNRFKQERQFDHWDIIYFIFNMQTNISGEDVAGIIFQSLCWVPFT